MFKDYLNFNQCVLANHDFSCFSLHCSESLLFPHMILRCPIDPCQRQPRSIFNQRHAPRFVRQPTAFRVVKRRSTRGGNRHGRARPPRLALRRCTGNSCQREKSGGALVLTAVLREAWATLPESNSRPLLATLAQSRNLAHASLETM